MQIFNNKIGLIHFIGIGGIGMSGIAEVLINLGFKVSGSDLLDNANTLRLKKLNIKITIGHKKENLEETAIVVISSAINPDNLELIEARKRRLPIVKRAEKGSLLSIIGLVVMKAEDQSRIKINGKTLTILFYS